MDKLDFIIVPHNKYYTENRNVFILEIDGWDDYGFRTSFNLWYMDENGKLSDIGFVKISKFDLPNNKEHIDLNGQFPLNDSYFSLGQDREYYENVNSLPAEIKYALLEQLQDLAYEKNEKSLKSARKDDSFKTSLLRDTPESIITDQYRRILKGEAPLTEYNFRYKSHGSEGGGNPFSIGFNISPNSTPPTNVHALIGENGVGKSKILREMFLCANNRNFEHAQLLIGSEEPTFITPFGPPPEKIQEFSNLIHVSFSAFDEREKWTVEMKNKDNAHIVGLAEEKDKGNLHDSLISSFKSSFHTCKQGLKRNRWLSAVLQIERGDTLLAEYCLSSAMREDEDIDKVANIFSELSSGHKIAILTISRLVELLEERSLVLIDEPEVHLHPPLLSSLIRTISALAKDRNSVVIIATHSPVILQEVPRHCVWRIQRSGSNIRAYEPKEECFGESVSKLTSDVFNLDQQETGYFTILHKLMKKNDFNVGKTLEDLEGQLGNEGIFALYAMTESNKGKNV